MELAGLLSRETVENAFLIGLLLTGDMKQAEDAVVESVDCSDIRDICGERIFRRVIRSSLGLRLRRSTSETIEDDSASAMLPLELRRVLRLPRDLRECFVLRMLIGLHDESCAWLLHVDPAEVRSRLQRAMARLGGFCADENDAARFERGQGQPSTVWA